MLSESEVGRHKSCGFSLLRITQVVRIADEGGVSLHHHVSICHELLFPVTFCIMSRAPKSKAWYLQFPL